MKKVKKLLFIFLFTIPFFIGIVNVKADDCGTVTVSANSTNNDRGGNIETKVSDKTVSTITYTIDVRARSFSNVNTIEYKIVNNDGKTCSNKLTKTDFGEHENIILKLTVDKNNTKNVTINASDIGDSLFNKDKVDDISPVTLNTQLDSSAMGNLIPSKNITCNDSIKKIVKELWGYLILVSPMLVIIMGTIDFVKALGSNDNDAIKKSSTSFIKRIIALCILMYLPMLIKVVFSWVGLESALCF